MKLSQRSYPHPVVGNADDVQDAAYQATVEMTTDKLGICPFDLPPVAIDTDTQRGY